MRNQTSFRLTTTLLPTDTTAKTTQVINKVDSDGNKFYPTFTSETVVLTNDDRTIIETTIASCTDWVLTFTKRGLSDDASETEIPNRKLTWNPWTLCFITAGAGDWIDKDDDVTWTGDQTYTGELISTNKATYKWQLVTEKWVKYPNFANTTCLQAYDSPFGWMFATVDDTGELYRYNAVTCCWDLVSTASLGTYEIRCSCTAPAAWTADTIVTLAPALSKIYLGTAEVVGNAKYVDVALVGWWGGCYNDAYKCTGWGWGWVYIGTQVGLGDKSSFCVKIWAAWTASGNGWATSIENIYSVSWGKWATCFNNPWVWVHWWAIDYAEYQWWCYASGSYSWYAWWWGARWNGGNWVSATCHACWGDWGRWVVTNFASWTSYWGRWGAWNGASSSVCTGSDGVTCCGYGVWGWSQWGACKWVAYIRYPSDWSYWIHCATGGTVTCCTIDGKAYKIHAFTSNWTFCIVS